MTSEQVKQYLLGREVVFALPPGCSVLKPSREALKVAANKLGVSVAMAERALDRYNWQSI